MCSKKLVDCRYLPNVEGMRENLAKFDFNLIPDFNYELVERVKYFLREQRTILHNKADQELKETHMLRSIKGGIFDKREEEKKIE